MRNICKLLAAIAVAGGLASCCKDNNPSDPSAKCYFAYTVDLTPIGDEYVCLYDSSYEPTFVAYDGGKVLPVDGKRNYIKFEFIDDSDTYFFYAGMFADKYEGWMYGLGALKGTPPGQKGSVRVTYDDGNIKFEKTLNLIADPIGGAEAVDLGLSVKWASLNVGATSPEEHGYYFAWGETTQKASYIWSEAGCYKWGVYDDSAAPKYGMTKYTADVEGGDGLKTLQPDDDPATANWGAEWRTPTFDEINELFDETKCTWDWDPTKKGYTVTSVEKGNSIFLPAAGLRNVTDLDDAGKVGYYWSSSVDESKPYQAHSFFFISDMHDRNFSSRFAGSSIRAVTEY